MITFEQQGKRYTVTILDDEAHDEDLKIVWETDKPLMYISQINDSYEDDVIFLSADQAYLLSKTLRIALGLENVLV